MRFLSFTDMGSMAWHGMTTRAYVLSMYKHETASK